MTEKSSTSEFILHVIKKNHETTMGQTGTKVASKLVNSFSFSATEEKEIETEDGTIVKFRGKTPLIYNRRG